MFGIPILFLRSAWQNFGVGKDVWVERVVALPSVRMAGCTHVRVSDSSTETSVSGILQEDAHPVERATGQPRPGFQQMPWYMQIRLTSEENHRRDHTHTEAQSSVDKEIGDLYDIRRRSM